MAPSVDREQKGEIAELKADLYDRDQKRTKKALKKMVHHASMSGTPLGSTSVEVLLPDVMHCLESSDIEMKKVVYMFLSSLAAANPDAVTIAFNRMTRDVSGPNPLVRAIALRTLTGVRVEAMAEGMVEPIRVGLHDSDPFVRKTAALSVAKAFDLSPEVVESGGLIPDLAKLLDDNNPHVVANAAAALNEIRQRAPYVVFELNMTAATKLLAALNECTQWNQVSILDTLVLFTPASEREAITILERVVPRLNHANASVVMSAVKIMLYNLSFLRSEVAKQSFSQKMAQPLCTLMSLPAELQYTCLRSLKIILQKYPAVLSAADVKTFFCKYNDPLFCKQEKIDIMIALATEANVHQILSELKEYCRDVDKDFARKAMQAVSTCAISFVSSVEFCIKIVLGVIEDKMPVVLQEAVVTVQTIFRKYPNRYESIISDVCSSLDDLNEPLAKAAIIWIIGEYSDRIESAEEILEIFFETYLEEESQVQLALLTALSKLYLNVESDGSVDMLQDLLGQTNNSVDDPDVRERALFYWRLLAGDLEVAREVVLAPKPPIESGDIIEGLDAETERILSKRIPYVSTVLFKRPSNFVSYKNLYACGKDFKDTGELSPSAGGNKKPESFENGSGGDFGTVEEEAKPAQADLLGDLLSLEVSAPAAMATGSTMPVPSPQGQVFSPQPVPTQFGLEAKPAFPPSPVAQAFQSEAFPAASQGGFGASDAFSFDQTPPQQGFVQQGSNAGQSNNPFF